MKKNKLFITFAAVAFVVMVIAVTPLWLSSFGRPLTLESEFSVSTDIRFDQNNTISGMKSVRVGRSTNGETSIFRHPGDAVELMLRVYAGSAFFRIVNWGGGVADYWYAITKSGAGYYDGVLWDGRTYETQIISSPEGFEVFVMARDSDSPGIRFEGMGIQTASGWSVQGLVTYW